MIFTTKRRVKPGLRSLCVLATAAITASACSADTINPAPQQADTMMEERESTGLASTDLNLLQTPQPRTSSRLRVRTSVGQGSYICSPAGFGQRSYCRSN